MSFPLDADEASRAQNLGSLEGYLGNQQYTVSQIPMQGEQVVRNEGNLGPVTAPGPADYAPQGTAPQQPSVSQAEFNAMVEYAQRMEQTAAIAAQQAIQAEETQFLAQLDYWVDTGQMTEAQRDVQIVLRRNQQLEQSQMTMAQRLQAEEDALEEQEQLDAKARVSYREAMAHGVNWFNNDVRAAIMEAETLDEMRSKLRVLRMYPGAILTPNQSAPQTRGQVANGAFAAASAAGSGGQTPKLKPGSDNLGNYIKQRGGYQVVSVE